MIWLTGNKGLLGSEVELRLISLGAKFVATDLEVDITSKEQVDAFVLKNRPSVIINCAAYTAVDKAESDTELAFQVNAIGPKNLAIAAERSGAAIVHISTDYVFDGTKDAPYTENDKTAPVTAYGRTKLQGEEEIVKTCKRYVIVRTSWLYGARPPSFVATMIKLFQTKSVVRIVCDQFGSPTYAKDLADAIVRIATEGCLHTGIYHFSNEGRTNWFEFASEIYRLCKLHGIVTSEVHLVPIPSSEYKTAAKRPLNSYLSKEKIKAIYKQDARNWRHALEDYFSTKGDKERK